MTSLGQVATVIDIFSRLRNSFKLSDETRKKSEKCQNEIEKLEFKNFHENYSCKSVKGIPVEEFKAFVTEKLQNRLSLPEKVVGSLLDGLTVEENEDKLNDFHFKDGEGNIHHGRFITMKREGKMDLAYAIYTLSFELAEKETKHEAYEWWYYVVPVWNVTYTKEARNLSQNEKDIFSQLCQVKLCNHVAEECSKDEISDS